ncbi:hypothetical protein [Streptomyces sp. NPDC059460]|uniref:hypothetical protein n=1 Tax=Streptomyces sp. NPDC059460 TaxID=3346840 RepID=UPI00368CAB51
MAAVLSPPGSVTAVGDSPYGIAAFLRSQRVAALPGIGPAAARSLSRYGINSIGEDGFLLELKSDPGRLGLETLLEEIVKLRRAKALGLPANVLGGVSDKLVASWRTRAMASHPSDLSANQPPVRFADTRKTPPDLSRRAGRAHGDGGVRRGAPPSAPG